MGIINKKDVTLSNDPLAISMNREEFEIKCEEFFNAIEKTGGYLSGGMICRIFSKHLRKYKYSIISCKSIFKLMLMEQKEYMSKNK